MRFVRKLAVIKNDIMKKYDLFLNLTATIIIGIAVIGILILSFNYLSGDNVETKTIKIEYQQFANDSTAHQIQNKIALKLDSTIQNLTEVSERIQKRQLQLIEDKENDNFFNKLYTAIVAIILSIAGFFGFKSMSEIKSRAIEEAKQEAANAAEKEFERTFNDEYEAKIFEKSNEAMNEFLRTEIASLEDRINILEEAMQENQIELPIDENENNDELENPFDNE